MGQTIRICKVARAKLNLALHVRGKRADGYHDLDSIFVHCVDGDELWVEPAETLSLQVTGPFAAGLSAGEDNLVMQAARAVHAEFHRDELQPAMEVTINLPEQGEDFAPSASSRQVMRHHFGASRGAAITLVKNLPLASGIGGGSADAAAIIGLLIALWDLPDDHTRVHAIAASLGADVAPCLTAWPKRVIGRGEEYQPLHDPAFHDWPVLLVNPGVELATGRIFAGWDGVDRGGIETPLFTEVVAHGRNDLEPAARELASAIGTVIDELASQPGVICSRMSGSGATCFALFGSAADRDAATAAIRTGHPTWWTLPTRLS